MAVSNLSFMILVSSRSSKLPGHSTSTLFAFRFIRLFLMKMRPVQIQIRWPRCAGWSRLTLVAQVKMHIHVYGVTVIDYLHVNHICKWWSAHTANYRIKQDQYLWYQFNFGGGGGFNLLQTNKYSCIQIFTFCQDRTYLQIMRFSAIYEFSEN
jgi:hypothetical protein